MAESSSAAHGPSHTTMPDPIGEGLWCVASDLPVSRTLLFLAGLRLVRENSLTFSANCYVWIPKNIGRSLYTVSDSERFIIRLKINNQCLIPMLQSIT
jgi:hypothetical protein